MKRFLIKSVIVILAAAALAPSQLEAQEYSSTPVTVSKEKIRIGGQVCYSHIVLEKQTLYSICKAYNVSAEDIYKYNPGVKENGLKKNSILIIPAVSETEKPVRQEVQEEAPQPASPEVKETVQPKQSIRAAGMKRKFHTAKWFEDLDMIAEKYGVSANAIMKANGLSTKKLTKRQKLMIPAPGEYPDEMAAAAEETAEVSDSTALNDSTEHERRSFPMFYFPKKEVDMSLLLPLKATGATASRQNMDFYSGVLLAVYDMAKEGISTNLNIYDVGDGSLPSEEDIINSDIIIGPVGAAEINNMFRAVPGIRSLVSPLDPRAESTAYLQKAMIHAPTPQTTQFNDLVSWLKEDMKPEDRVFVFSEKGARITETIANMTAAIDSSGIEYTPLSYSILEGRDVTDTLHTFLADSAANRIYIASESEAFVNDVVRNLNVTIHQKYDVILYAPSKIRSFETIEVENFHNTKMRVSTGYYIDYDDPKVKAFLLRYRALFNTEPTQFAYQGYDLAKYFIGICSKYGSRWMERLDEEKASMLQSTFDFTRTENGGFVNSGVRRIVYGDRWSVRKIR